MRVVTGLALLALLTACPGSSKTRVPARLVVVAGDGVSAPAGDQIDVAVRVLDASDRPVAGAPVAFQVIEGRGTVPPAELQSDADGLVTARWQLDTDTVINRLNASGVNGMHVILTATGVPGPVVSIEKVGDRQFAAAGSVVTMAFRLRDRLGHRAPGAAATCTVDAGGGSATPGPSPDPAWDGVCAWTLGATPRVENRLTVTAGSASPVTFTAWTGVPSPITVRTTSTLADRTGVVYSPIGIRWLILVDSLLEVVSVTAHVGGQTTPLVKGTNLLSPFAWAGFTPGDAFQRGPLVARVTAVDVRGTEGDLFLWFDVDRPPVITIASPLDQSLVRTGVTVEATCTDDDPAGCTSMTAGLDGSTQTLAGTSSVAGAFTLAGLQPGAIRVVFSAQDSAGSFVQETRTVWLESSQNLVEVGAAPGVVLDATTTTALYRVPGAVGLADLATGATTSVADPGEAQVGFVATTGAAWVGRLPGSTNLEALLWEPPGAPQALGRVPATAALEVAGPWLLLSRGPGVFTTDLVRRDLATGAEVIVTTGETTFASGLADNGDVVFVSAVDHDLWRYRDGPTPLAPLTRDGQARGRPRSDGARVLYAKEVAPGDFRAILFDGTDQPLGTASFCLDEPCLALSGAWAAFIGPGQTGLPQLWRSGPGGLEQITFFSQRSTLEALTPDGVAVLRNGATRYRSAPGALDPEPIGAALGRVVVRDGKALVLLGRSVLEIVP